MKLYNELSQEQIETARKFLKPYGAEQFLPHVEMAMTGDLGPGEFLTLIGAIGQLAYQKGMNTYAETINKSLKSF